jgi:ADP-ribose pyrophosphatase YjhB (NUDIX family)
MRVNVRALIVRERKVVVSRERRQGVEHVLLPGGRVRDGESIHEALTREVSEETGLTVSADRLLYVAEVVGMYGVHDLILIWSAEPQDTDVAIPDDVLLDVDSEQARSIMPPVMVQISGDLNNGGAEHPRWLGNVRRPARP